jgi:hypothetical protein
MAFLKEKIAAETDEKRLKILAVLITDEVFDKYGFEEEELTWTFNNTKVSRADVARFQELDNRYAQILSSKEAN